MPCARLHHINSDTTRGFICEVYFPFTADLEQKKAMEELGIAKFVPNLDDFLAQCDAVRCAILRGHLCSCF